MVTRKVTACPITTRVQIEAQLVTALLGDAGAAEEDVDQPIFYSPEPFGSSRLRSSGIFGSSDSLVVVVMVR